MAGKLTNTNSGEIRPLRTLTIGAALAGLVGFWGPYNALVLLGPETTTDFTNAAAVFLLFFIAFFVNGLLRRFLPRHSFSSGELFIIYVMSAISCSITTMGFTLYLVPMLPAISYFATPENQWAELIQPFVPHWLVPQGEEAIRGFYEGITKDEAIPWGVWIKPLLAWLPVLLGLYLVMIALPMLFRKQWIEHERLAYPLAQLPLLMGGQESNRSLNSFFRNPVMWVGFAIPFIIGSMSALHAHYNFIPRIDLGYNLSIFQGTDSLNLRLTFPMMGFAYLVHQEVALSVWVFYLLGLLVKGYFNMMGVSRGVTVDLYGQSDGGPIMAYVQFGALMALVGNALWISRRPLRQLLRTALHSEEVDGGDDLLTRSLLFQLLLGLLLMVGWFVAIGVPWWASLAFVLVAAASFLGITRIVCESGLALMRSQLISSTVVRTFFGTALLGPQGALGVLAFGQAWMSDVRNFVMASVANGLKLTESIKRKGTVFWGMVLAVLLGFTVSTATTLYYAYQSGAINASSWFFYNGPRYAINFAAHFLSTPVGPDVGGIGLMSLGGAIMLGLYWLRAHVLFFPIHPIGFSVSQMMLTRHLWFSVFVVWLIKALVMHFGGPRVLQATRPFFLGADPRPIHRVCFLAGGRPCNWGTRVWTGCAVTGPQARPGPPAIPINRRPSARLLFSFPSG